MLEPIGLDQLQERIYRHVLRLGRSTVVDVARAADSAPRETGRILRELERKGLVSRAPTKPLRFAPVAPDVALEVLINARQQELERVRAHSADLLEDFRNQAQRGRSRELVEMVFGPEAIFQRFLQMQQAASEQIRIFDRPPYAQPGLNPVELQLLEKGIRFRVLYDRLALEYPGQTELLEQVTAAGEEARVIPALPMKLIIADRLLAIVPLYVDHPDTKELRIEEALIVHPGALLDCLAENFEILWERAVPLPASGDVEPLEATPLSEEDRRILQLMIAGLKDERIARELGMGARTVQRRISRLMTLMGTETRFQAGFQAARLGWLS